MKKVVFILFLISNLHVSAFSQKDTALERRLQEFLRVNDRMELDRVLDYTYPKLFSIVPRKQMLNILKSTFDNEEMSIALDSLAIVNVFPVFKVENGYYAKVIYSMNMLMSFKEDPSDSLSAEDKSERDEFMLNHMAKEYGAGNVSIDPATGALKIKVVSPMVAIKDSYAKDWTFVNLKDNDPLSSRLFSKPVLNKLATYK